MKHVKGFESFSEVNSIDEAKVYGNSQIEDALDNAEEAFWNSVAGSFPEITSGDFTPGDSAKLRNALKTAVNTWLKINSK
jgi:hypothetical protein